MTAYCHTQLLSKPVTLLFLQWLRGLAFLSMVLLRVFTARLPWSSFIAVLCFACAFCACLLHCLGYLLLDFICGSFGASCASLTLSLIRSLGGFLGSDYSLSVVMCPHRVLWWFAFLQRSLYTTNFCLVSGFGSYLFHGFASPSCWTACYAV